MKKEERQKYVFIGHTLNECQRTSKIAHTYIIVKEKYFIVTNIGRAPGKNIIKKIFQHQNLADLNWNHFELPVAERLTLAE